MKLRVRQADRFIAWMRGWRARRRAARNLRKVARQAERSAGRGPGRQPAAGEVLEATVPISGHEPEDGGSGRGALAS
jgi:hypothetical protein